MPKTIFGTTERSNFILNMKHKTVQNWLFIAAFAAVCLPILGGVVPSVSDVKYYWMSIGIYTAGFFALLCFLTAALRGDVKPAHNKGFWAVVFITVWSFFSYAYTMANPYEGLANPSRPSGLFTPLIGEYGRYEGLLSLIAYAGIFFVGVCISEKKTINRVFDIIIAMGIFQSLWGILQHIPGLGFPNMYKDLPTLSYDNVYMASGTTDSPIFFGAFLTLAGGVAVISAAFAKSAKRRVLCGAAALMMFTVGLFTSSITPIIGFCAVVIFGFIWAIFSYKKTKNKAPLIIMGILTVALAVIFIIVLLTQGIWIRDAYIARFDEFYRKSIMGATVNDSRSLYNVAWNKSLAVIRQFPIFGVGPDCLAAFLNFATMNYDKSYNEFLYIAATRGIPALIGFITLIVLFVVRMKKQAAKYADPLTFVIITAAGAYLIQSFVNASAITVAPIFWLLTGIGFSDIKFDKQDK
jgi:hypothetical protein